MMIDCTGFVRGMAIISNWYNILSKMCAISSFIFGIIPILGWIMFWRLLKKNEQKRLEEVTPQLLRLLRLITIGIVLSGISGIIAILMR